MIMLVLVSEAGTFQPVIYFYKSAKRKCNSKKDGIDFFPLAVIWLVHSVSPVAEAGFWPISWPETKLKPFC